MEPFVKFHTITRKPLIDFVPKVSENRDPPTVKLFCTPYLGE